MWKQSVCYILAFCIIAKSLSSFTQDIVLILATTTRAENEKSMQNYMITAVDASAKSFPGEIHNGHQNQQNEGAHSFIYAFVTIY